MNQIDKISNIIQKNFISKISFFSKYLITTKVLETKHFARIDASIPSNTFNIAVIKKQNTENIKSILAQTADYFNNKTVIINADRSATGTAIKIPSKPIIDEKIMIQGIKIIICLNKFKTLDIFILPIA